MILYHAISTYQLLEMILYRKRQCNKEKAILLITDTLRDKFPDMEKYKVFFSDVWVYDINLEFRPKVTFQTVIDNYFNSYFKEKNIELTELEQINVGCAHYYFGHYLTGNSIPFVYFEDAAGMLSRPDILYNIEIDKRPFKTKRNVERGLYDGSNSVIYKIVCNFEAQEGNVVSDIIKNATKKIEDFNVVKELLNVEDEFKKQVISMFLNIDSIEIENDVSIVLTQHFANLGILSFQEQEKIYKLTLDYFYNNKKLVIKPHPDDIMYYQKFSNDISIIKERFPSEFLPALIKAKIGEISTISSTAIKNYYNCGYNIFELNTDFEKTYLSLHRYYVTLKLLEFFKQKYTVYGCDFKIIESLINRNSEFRAIGLADNADFLLVDDYFDLRYSDDKEVCNEKFLQSMYEKIKGNSKTIIFLNSNNYYSFFYRELNIFENIVPIKINIKNYQHEWWDYSKDSTYETQYIYVYTQDEFVRSKVMEFNMEKELKISQTVIKVDALSDYEREIYEGKIRALEARLKYYIQLSEKRGDHV